MKKYINKIIVGVFSLALVLSAQSVFAGTWNGASNDCNSISIANATTNQGYGDPCWDSSSVSADPGDTLNIRIYYHNTGTTTANNTRIKLNAPVGGSAGTSKSFSGSITSDQGDLSLSAVTANLSSSQTITFNSVKWYTNNKSVTLTPLLNGQSGSAILSGSGLDIGSILPGWATQGSLVVSFHVSNTSAPELCKETSATNYGGPLPCVYPPKVCSISNFSASPSSITKGNSSVLSWNTSNCNNVSIYPTLENVNTFGSRSVYPTSSTTYTITADGITRTTSVSVSSPNIMTGNLDASSSSCIIAAGASSCSIPFTWSTQNPEATSSITNNSSTVATGNSGYKSLSVRYGYSQEFYLYNNSKLLDTESVSANCGVNASWNGSYCENNVIPSTCSITNFSASPSSITKGNSSTLNWGTNNCSSVTISDIGTVSNSGSKLVYPTYTTTYTLKAFNSSGSLSDTDTVTVSVNEESKQYCTISSFTASDTSIDKGDSTVLRWNTNNCDDISISSIGDVSDDGSKTVYPNSDKTYTLTAYGYGGTKTDSVKIYVDDTDEDNDDEDVCYIDSFTASDTSIKYGDSVTLRWNTTDCDGVTLGTIGGVSDDGSKLVYPYSTTTYVLSAYGNGNKSKSIKIYVDNEVVIPTYNINVATTIATNISQSGAQLNGLITSSNYTNASVYFEYGKTVNLGSRTAGRSTNGNSNFNEYVSGLSANTIYYFQAVSSGADGISRGAIEVFKTSGYTYTDTNTNTNTNTVKTNTIIKEVYIEGNTVYGSDSPIMLKIENKYQSIGVGDVIDYTVYYKNISNSRLTDPMVQVYVPSGIVLVNASRGTYGQDGRTLSAPIEDLNPGDDGYIYLQGKVVSMDSSLAQMVTTAVLVYTTPNNAQENAMAYVLNNPKIINVMGASAFTGAFFGLSLIGWLILIIIILILILIVRSFYNRRDVVVHNNNTPTHQ